MNETTTSPIMSKNSYLQTAFDMQIEALRSTQGKFANVETGEVDRIMAAKVARTNVLIGILMQGKHLAKVNEGKDYSIFLGFVRPTVWRRIVASFRKRSYIYTKEYNNKFLGSIKWALQEVNLSAGKNGEDIVPVRALQGRVRVLKEITLPKFKGSCTLGMVVKYNK